MASGYAAGRCEFKTAVLTKANLKEAEALRAARQPSHNTFIQHFIFIPCQNDTDFTGAGYTVLRMPERCKTHTWTSVKFSRACASGQVENLRDAVRDRFSGFLTRFFLKGSGTADGRHCMQIRHSAIN